MYTQIILVNPSVDESSQNSRVRAIVYKTFPSSLAILAGCLLKEGFTDVTIIDEQISPIDEARIKDLFNPKAKLAVVGFSVLTLNSGRAYHLAGMLKRHHPLVKVVFGGIHPTVATDEVLQSGVVDIVVRGEGEVSFVNLVRNLDKGIDYRMLAGLSLRKPGSLQIQNNENQPLVDDLDTIPPMPYHLFENDLQKYPSFATIMGSRGCPFQCTFCSSRSISGKRYRFHSVERIVDELKTLVREYKQTFVYFMDDNIAVNKKHFVELCDRIIAEGLHNETKFCGSLRGDNATDEVLSKAKAAGFEIIYFGMETGVERLMKIINKGETVEEVVEAIKKAHKHGLKVGTTIIFGLPTETREDRKQTIALTKSLPIADIRFNTLTPYPGTPAFMDLFPKGKIIIKENWMNFGVQYLWESDDIPYVPDESDRLELIWDTMYANISRYIGLKPLWKLLTSPVTGGKVIALKNNWYLSPAEVFKVSSLFVFLVFRFFKVSSSLAIRRLARAR